MVEKMIVRKYTLDCIPIWKGFSFLIKITFNIWGLMKQIKLKHISMKFINLFSLQGIKDCQDIKA